MKKRKKILAFFVTAALAIGSLPAAAAVNLQTGDETESHLHSDACYGSVLVCTKEERESHAHADNCYGLVLSCMEAEHTHSSECYDPVGNLICDTDEHTHEDACYQQTLTCGLEEREGHTHTYSCYEQQLICGYSDENADTENSGNKTELSEKDLAAVTSLKNLIDEFLSAHQLALENGDEGIDKLEHMREEITEAYDALSPEAQALVDNYSSFLEIINGDISSISEDSVASVDGKGYNTLKEAYAEAEKSAGTIVLLKDISMDGYWFEISSTVTVDLNDCSISARPGGFVFYIVEGGNLTLKGSGNVNGGGYDYGIIWNANGTLKIEDSVVLQNNEAGSSGWGGAVYNTGKFIMDGGSIQNTSAAGGGAVCNMGIFTMNNGTISQTSATWYGGAVYNTGTFEMNGGRLGNCKTTEGTSYGGAVYNTGNMVMNGGTVSNCTTSIGGGGVHLKSGSFTMNNGTIEGCKVTSSRFGGSLGGGGVSVQSGATFTMNNGLIWKNKSSGGDGGSGVANDGTFTMTGGQIIMNDATGPDGYANLGGGVNNTSTMTMSGGMIAKNNGMGGVYSGDRDSRFTMTGGAVFENYALAISSVGVTEENKKVDIVLHASHQGNDDVSVCKASDMTAYGYAFTAWKYIGKGWRVAKTYENQDITGTLVPSNSELEIAGTDQIFFRAVFTASEVEGKEGIYLNGTLGDDNKDGTNAENAVRTFEKAWQLANKKLDGNEEEPVTIYVCGEVRISGREAWGENNAKNIIVMRADGYRGELAKVTAGGALTLQNITIDGNKGTEYTDSLVHVMGGGKLLIQEGAVLQNNLAGRESKGYDGGAVYIENGTGEMTGGVIQNNTARNNGGGVSVCHGTFTMSGGEIVGNTAVYGGGICAVRGGRVELRDNALISKNSASDGGGVNLGAHTTAEAYYGNEKQTLEMTGGTISTNSASNNGGGIFIQSNSSAIIREGDIVENEITGGSSFRYRGAGIYVNGGKGNQLDTDDEIPNGLLQLYNAEIADNIANEYGGGLAACPTANVKIYVTDGAVFHNNRLDTKSALDIYIAESKNQNSTSYVSDFMLGGGMYQWFWGDSAEGIRAEQSQYQDTAAEVLLSGLCNAADVEKAVELATVHITGNHAQKGSGGGIAANGDVIIGTPDPSETEAEITISKSWEDNNNKYNTRPDKIKLDLQYGKYTLRGIELTEANNWTTTLKNMPNDILQQQDPSVHVLEYDSGKYSLGKVKGEIQGTTLTISIENQYTHPTGNLTVSKIVSGSSASNTKEFAFTVTLDDKTISGTYGDMVFENGVANFTLKTGESKTTSNLPAGVTYEVVEQEANTDGYTTSSVGETGAIQANKTAEAIFNNHKDSSGGSSYTSVSVKKVWKLDDGGAAADSVTVNLLRNGVIYATVKLDSSNNWSYSWNRLNDSYIWTVEEVNVPDGFMVTIDRAPGNSFTIINDDNPNEPDKPDNPDVPDDPDEPDDPDVPDTPDNPDTPNTPDEPDNPSTSEEPGLPQTGQLWWPVVLALMFGFALLAIGIQDMQRHRYHGKHEK